MLNQPFNILTESPTVSIIMNCFNGEKYLRKAIDSIYAQTYKDWEIIFWDNASKDDSAEIAKSYDSRLRYFRGEKTLSLFSARDLALRESRGQYIAFLDTDDIWLPQKLEWQVQLFADDCRIGMVYSNGEIIEENGSISKMHGGKTQPSGRIFREMLGHYNLSLLTVMISKKTLTSLEEWFDSTLEHLGDADFLLRIAYGWDVKYLPEITARYRDHSGSRTYKYVEDFPWEVEYIINKLSNLHTHFREEYVVEIMKFRMRPQKALAVLKWKTGRSSEARLMIKHLLSVRSFVLLYLMSFFPYKKIRSIRNSILFKWL